MANVGAVPMSQQITLRPASTDLLPNVAALHLTTAVDDVIDCAHQWNLAMRHRQEPQPSATEKEQQEKKKQTMRDAFLGAFTREANYQDAVQVNLLSKHGEGRERSAWLYDIVNAVEFLKIGLSRYYNVSGDAAAEKIMQLLLKQIAVKYVRHTDNAWYDEQHELIILLMPTPSSEDNECRCIDSVPKPNKTIVQALTRNGLAHSQKLFFDDSILLWNQPYPNKDINFVAVIPSGERLKSMRDVLQEWARNPLGFVNKARDEGL